MAASPRRQVIASALAVVLASCPAFGQGSLEGRLVTFTVLTYDDPAQPYLQARGRTVMVGQGVEFGLGPEGKRVPPGGMRLQREGSVHHVALSLIASPLVTGDRKPLRPRS